VRQISLVLLFWSFVCATVCTAQAETAAIATYARDLATPAKQRQTLEQLRDLGDPGVRGILLALKEGALYHWQDRLFIFTSDGVFVGLDGKPLLDNTGQPLFPETGMDAVPLAQDNMPLLQQALDVIELFAPDPATRKSTALRLGNLQQVDLMPMLQKAHARETERTVQATLVEALNKLRLFSPDPVVRLQGVHYFEVMRAEAALGRLKDLQQTELDPQVRTAVVKAVQKIETFLQLRNGVGYVFNGLSLASVLLLMSLGLAITFGLMGIINMAHGEMLMLGSYTAYVLQEFFLNTFPNYLDYYFIVALPLSVVVVGGVGMLMERGILRFLYGRPLESLLVTWGIGMVLQQGARLYFGDQTSVSPPTWFRDG
jgi:urea transport system permease protein